MDTVILAAGNGSRLKGIAATGMKPLLVVNGEALVARLVSQAFRYVGGRVVVVTSPINTQAICSLVGNDVTYIVQPEAVGPGDAFRRGLEATHGELVMMLAGDNHMPDGDVMVCATKTMAVGVRKTDDPDVARRFTRLGMDGKGDFLSEEGKILGWGSPWRLWCGPLVVPRSTAHRVLSFKDGNQLIGPHLPEIFEGRMPECVPCDARDIGVAEELT